jgi:hypothetical protein
LSIPYLYIMKRLLTLFIPVIFSLNVFSQASNWLWARASIGSYLEEGYSVATDDSGNVFITGSFYDTTITFGTITLINAGLCDMFLVKYDGMGNVLWAISAGGAGGDIGNSTTTGDSGNVFVTGVFYSATIAFGTTTLTNSGSGTMFIVKYDGEGNVLWAKSAGGISACIGSGSTTDTSGNVFVTGYFAWTITFGTTTLTNPGNYDIFIVKYDGSGNVLWAKGVGGMGDDRGNSIATDPLGNVFVTGYFYSPTVTFDTITLTGAGINTFIAKYNSGGNALWVKSPGGTWDEGFSITTDPLGSVFITGYFRSASITFGTTTFTNAGLQDVYLTKYDGMGNVLWAKSAGGTGSDAGFCTATDDSGNVYVSGGFLSSSITFDSHTLLFPTGANDPMFLVKYNASGEVLCASVLASGGDDQNGVTTDAFGNAFVGGDFATVNPFIVGSDSLPLTGSETIFVAKYYCGLLENVNEISNGEKATLLPNPFHETAKLTFNTSKIQEGTIEIKNIFGALVSPPKHFAGNTIQLQRNNLPAGIYFYTITTKANQILNGKFIID